MDIKKLLSQMTLEEKLAQMTQFNANIIYSESEGGVTGPAADLNLTKKETSAVGSTLNFYGAEDMLKIQKAHLEEDRLGIPLLFMMDVIHGYRTIYPIPLGMGASFDEDILKECAQMAAKEAAVGGVQVTFSPMVDLVRDARWGRCMESTGEDNYLNARMAKAQIEGYQGDYSSKYNICACVKHFAAYGAAESGRDYNTVDMSLHSLYQDYLPSYRAAIDAGVDMLMTSFNTIGGVPSSGNKWLLNDLLRKEWGFDKIVISDYNAFGEMITHGFCANADEVADKACSAGTDIEMMSTSYIKSGKKLIEEGKITEEQIDKSVLRILELKNKMGLFDNPYGVASVEEEKRIHLCPEHRDLARRAAEKSAVLLKNEGVLPFGNNGKVAVIGPFADRGMIGSWACWGKDFEASTVKQGVANIIGEDNVSVSLGCEGWLNEKPNADIIKDAVAVAKKADKVVICVGEMSGFSGEGNSRADITLSCAQKELIKKVTEVNSNAVIVVFSGRPLALGDIIDNCPAVVLAWQPGTEGGNAIANLLFGNVDFYGRLPMTMPYVVGQVPIYYNRMNTGRPKPSEDYSLGYVSQYLDCPNAPLYPFGYGLCYTDFEIGECNLSSEEMQEGGSIKVSATVKNIGKKKGSALVQMYIRDLVASLVRPVKEMKGYQRVELDVGEEKTVEFTLTEEDLKFYNFDNNYVAEKGEFSVFVGLSSAEMRCKNFMLK